MLEDDDSLLPKTGQQGFLDLSKAQDPIDLEDKAEDLGEYDPSEPPGAEEGSPNKEAELIRMNAPLAVMNLEKFVR